MGSNLSTPRINQCMSCSNYCPLKRCAVGEDVEAEGFCYVYGDLEDEGSASEDGAFDLSDEELKRVDDSHGGYFEELKEKGIYYD